MEGYCEERRGSGDTRRSAFTLIELLTVMVIVGLLVAILLPAMNIARESGRATTCRNNLREFGIGLHGVATRNGGLLGTGAFDWMRDGAVTEVGWVADLVNTGTPVGKMLCPSNSSQLSETYLDLLEADTAAFDTCLDRLGTPEGTAPDGGPLINPCRYIAGEFSGGGALAAGSPARLKVIEEQILEEGYNTNYTAAWFLVRSAPRLDDSGNVQGVKPLPCPAANRDLNGTKGPLHLAMIESGYKPSSHVPLLGDGGIGRVTTQQIGPYPPASTAVRSMTAGPVIESTMQPPTFPSGTPRNGAAGWWKVWSQEVRQDYRAFGPVHRGGDCNVLFADGGVRSFSDRNLDGVLNNGFAANPANGFQSADIEFPADVVSSYFTVRQ